MTSRETLCFIPLALHKMQKNQQSHLYCLHWAVSVWNNEQIFRLLPLSRGEKLSELQQEFQDEALVEETVM